jgi:hypothetical protein
MAWSQALVQVGTLKNRVQKVVILTLAVAVNGVFAMAQWTRDPGGRGFGG